MKSQPDLHENSLERIQGRIETGQSIDDACQYIMSIMAEAFDPQFGEAWNYHQTLSMLCMPNSRHGIMLDEQDQPLAFSISRKVGEDLELLMIAVRPSARRRGHANAMLDAVIDRCREDKIGKIFLEVRQNNPARKFYELSGFTQIGLRKNYYTGMEGNRYDALTYAFSLTNTL